MYGEVLAPDGVVLASGWVNSGPEMLPEKLGAVLEKKIKKMAGCVDFTEACQNFSIFQTMARMKIKCNRCLSKAEVVFMNELTFHKF
jgi:hypothetical protein